MRGQSIWEVTRNQTSYFSEYVAWTDGHLGVVVFGPNPESLDNDGWTLILKGNGIGSEIEVRGLPAEASWAQVRELVLEIIREKRDQLLANYAEVEAQFPHAIPEHTTASVR